MKPERVFCRADDKQGIIDFVCDGLKEDKEWIGDCEALGLYQGKNLIAGVIFNNIRPQRDCWLTIYTTTPYWATKSTLRTIFDIVFDFFKCQRCSVLISESNAKSLDMCKRLGFIEEGLLRNYRENGENCYLMGMLKSECKWRKDK